MKNIWIKTAFVLIALIITNSSYAALTKFIFTLNGFSNGGSITGSIIGEDLNGDGYLSSFPFSQGVDFAGTGLNAGLDEVKMVTATFNGAFNAGLSGFGIPDPVTSFTIKNDLRDITDVIDPIFAPFPLDLFFVLNYKLDGGVLGDDALEGLVFGEADQPFVLGLGSFLPAPFGTTTPGGLLPGGTSLTSGLIFDNSGGTPCDGVGACGVIHSVLPNITVGGFDLTNGFASVIEVPEPTVGLLFSISILGLVVTHRRRDFKLKSDL